MDIERKLHDLEEKTDEIIKEIAGFRRDLGIKIAITSSLVFLSVLSVFLLILTKLP